MALARTLSISPQAAVTFPELVPGRTERRERKWIRSELAFLRRGGGFESIGTDLLPHLLRQWGEHIGTPNLRIFAFCNRLQQIATVCNSFSREPDFCNSLQQIVTTAGSKDPSQTVKNPVVEHKGIVRREVGFGDLLRGC
jgi:hypothetical protein